MFQNLLQNEAQISQFICFQLLAVPASNSNGSDSLIVWRGADLVQTCQINWSPNLSVNGLVYYVLIMNEAIIDFAVVFLYILRRVEQQHSYPLNFFEQQSFKYIILQMDKKQYQPTTSTTLYTQQVIPLNSIPDSKCDNKNNKKPIRERLEQILAKLHDRKQQIFSRLHHTAHESKSSVKQSRQLQDKVTKNQSQVANQLLTSKIDCPIQQQQAYIYLNKTNKQINDSKIVKKNESNITNKKSISLLENKIQQCETIINELKLSYKQRSEIIANRFAHNEALSMRLLTLSSTIGYKVSHELKCMNQQKLKEFQQQQIQPKQKDIKMYLLQIEEKIMDKNLKPIKVLCEFYLNHTLFSKQNLECDRQHIQILIKRIKSSNDWLIQQIASNKLVNELYGYLIAKKFSFRHQYIDTDKFSLTSQQLHSENQSEVSFECENQKQLKRSDHDLWMHYLRALKQYEKYLGNNNNIQSRYKTQENLEIYLNEAIIEQKQIKQTIKKNKNIMEQLSDKNVEIKQEIEFKTAYLQTIYEKQRLFEERQKQTQRPKQQQKIQDQVHEQKQLKEINQAIRYFEAKLKMEKTFTQDTTTKCSKINSNLQQDNNYPKTKRKKDNEMRTLKKLLYSRQSSKHFSDFQDSKKMLSPPHMGGKNLQNLSFDNYTSAKKMNRKGTMDLSIRSPPHGLSASASDNYLAIYRSNSKRKFTSPNSYANSFKKKTWK